MYFYKVNGEILDQTSNMYHCVTKSIFRSATGIMQSRNLSPDAWLLITPVPELEMLLSQSDIPFTVAVVVCPK